MGLPHCWRPFRARCYATPRNVATTRGASPIASRHVGDGFAGPLIPLGALVYAIPSGIHRKRNLKFEPPLRPAVFLGYIVQGGGKWFGEFLWAFVDDLADRPFYSRARWSECRVMVHSGRELRFDAVAEILFPCAELYRRGDDDAAGVRRCLSEAAEADEDSHAQARDEARADDLTDDHRDDDREDGVGPGGDPSVELHHGREPYPTAVYGEMESLKQEIAPLRHQLEFLPSGQSVHGKPIGHAEDEPSAVLPEEWQAMEVSRGRRATIAYTAERAELASKHDRAAVLGVLLEDYTKPGGGGWVPG